jgi:hypothetical protein
MTFTSLNKMIKKCELCEKEYKTSPSGINRRRFCSYSCKAKALNGNRKGKPLSVNRQNQLARLHNQTRIKNPMAGISRYGSENPKWEGGITPLYRSIRQIEKYSIWRKQVLSYNNYKCNLCGNIGLEAHHIKSFKTIITENNIQTTKEASDCEELWFITNGLCLCKRCHYNLHMVKK